MITLLLSFQMTQRSVLFVCLGNICRSPMAEAVFLDLIKKRNVENQWKVDSAATAEYHVGRGPDDRTMKVLHNHSINDYRHTVRMVRTEDFDEFDIIFAMDDDNVQDLTEMCPSTKFKAKIELLGKYDPSNRNKHIPDPYYVRMERPLMYVVVREDLLKTLRWTFGAVMTQACHACSAALWTFREDALVQEYMSDLNRMTKVLLKVADEEALKELSKTLQSANVDHTMWTETPEDVATALALKPAFKRDVQNFVKHLALFK